MRIIAQAIEARVGNSGWSGGMRRLVQVRGEAILRSSKRRGSAQKSNLPFLYATLREKEPLS